MEINRDEGIRPPIEELVGALPDWAIKEAIEKGIIKIDPLVPDWKEKAGSMTIDFRLGNRILLPKQRPGHWLDVKRGVTEDDFEILNFDTGGTVNIAPNQFMVVPTMEKLTLPRDIVARLEGRSSLARLGLVVHMTSGRFDPGWDGYPVLEIRNNNSEGVTIYTGWPICAFSFERLSWPVERSYTERGRYAGSGAETIHSLIHKDNSNKE